MHSVLLLSPVPNYTPKDPFSLPTSVSSRTLESFSGFLLYVRRVRGGVVRPDGVQPVGLVVRVVSTHPDVGGASKIFSFNVFLFF